jgi:hypothetical protein
MPEAACRRLSLPQNRPSGPEALTGSPTTMSRPPPVSGSVRCAPTHSGVLPAATRKRSAHIRRHPRPAASARILLFMKVSAFAIAAAVTLPAHVLLILSGGAAVVILLVYLGIALPAVWSAKPARRKAATAVLRQILNACTGDDRR